MLDLINIYLYEKRLNWSSRSIATYRSILENYVVHIEKNGKTIENATKLDIISYLSELVDNKKLKKSSVRTHLAILKAFYAYLLDNEYIKINPAKKIDNIKPDIKAPIYLNFEEMKRLIDTCIKPRDRIMVLLFCTTGIRVSELVNLRKSDINIYENTVKIFGKGSKERTVPLRKSVVVEIMDYCKDMNDDEKIIKISIQRVEYIITVLGKRANIEKRITPHKLRHSFATGMINNGCDLMALSNMLGHAGIATTGIYMHNSLNDLKEKYNKYQMLA